MILENRKENLKNIQDKIEKAANRAGRKPEEITLLAVSKVFVVRDISEVYNLGMRDFGENRAQEYRDKVSEISLPINWHFIGSLQTNKIKYIVGTKSRFKYSNRPIAKGYF